ncbi:MULTISPECIES: DUF4190 domain-containing protein [unclassified Agrococcus]|uniref:DUF4190 domain-containing protein n=1 Tax=unclassified Agrococcus TaxID=2615065 RepID=UPI003617522D
MTTTPPPPGDPQRAPHPTPEGWVQPSRWDVVQQPTQQQHAPSAWAAQQRYAAPRQFRPVPDAMLESQRSTRFATRALVWGVVALVVSMVPVLNWFTLVPGIVAIQFGAAARMQRLAGGGRAVWAIVLGALGILGSAGWILLHVVTFFGWMASAVTSTV